MQRSMTAAENYVVCGRLEISDAPVGSVKERCFACNHFVIVYPSSQRLLMQRIDLHLKIVCNSCYLRAPDKDHIRPIQESDTTRELVSTIRHGIRSAK